MSASAGTGRATLQVYIPGLFGTESWREQAPSTPALQWLLARAARVPVAGRVNELGLLRFFYSAPPGVQFAVADLTALHDFEADTATAWMRADPVYLRPDRDTLVLFDASTFELGEREARELVAGVNQQLEHRGLALVVGKAPTRWYLRLQQPPKIVTQALAQVAGRSTFELLPTGPESSYWQQVANELQMALHPSPVNQARIDRGVVPVNSTWFWGCGSAPPVAEFSPGLVWSDDALAGGLARHAGGECRACPEAATELDLGAAREHLLVIDTLSSAALYGDHERWFASLLKLEKDWFAPLRESLKAGVLHQLALCTAHCDFRLSPAAQWCFWRRPHALTRYAPEPGYDGVK